MSAERMERARAFLSDRIIKKENGYLLAEEDGIFGAKGKDGKLWGYSELMAAFAAEEVRLERERLSDQWDDAHAMLSKAGIPDQQDGSFLSLDTRIQMLADKVEPARDGGQGNG